MFQPVCLCFRPNAFALSGRNSHIRQIPWRCHGLCAYRAFSPFLSYFTYHSKCRMNHKKRHTRAYCRFVVLLTKRPLCLHFVFSWCKILGIFGTQKRFARNVPILLNFIIVLIMCGLTENGKMCAPLFTAKRHEMTLQKGAYCKLEGCFSHCESMLIA